MDEWNDYKIYNKEWAYKSSIEMTSIVVKMEENRLRIKMAQACFNEREIDSQQISKENACR